MARASLDLIRGTLDLLILKTLTWGPLHGYSIASTIKQSTDGALLVEEGALYPALYRMEEKGWIESEWGRSSNNRRAKYYRLTARGRQHFRNEEQTWNAYAVAVEKVLATEFRVARSSEVEKLSCYLSLRRKNHTSVL